MILSIECADDYAAMLLYDDMCQKLREGHMEIELSGAVPRDGVRTR